METSTKIRIGIVIIFFLAAGLYMALGPKPVYLDEKNCTSLIFQKYPELSEYQDELNEKNYEITEEGGYSKEVFFSSNKSFGYIDFIDNDEKHDRLLGCYVISYDDTIENSYQKNYSCGITTGMSEKSITNSTVYYSINKTDKFIELDVAQKEKTDDDYIVVELTTFYSPALYTDKVENLLKSSGCIDEIFSIFVKEKRRK